MTDNKSKALQVKEKTELARPMEQTRLGLVFTPDVDIFETEKEMIILADMPGVKSDNLKIDLREAVLTLDGEVQAPEGEVEIYREYRTGKYYRQFYLSEVIDQAKIEAEMKDGVLRLKLPKVEAAKPRKISVKAS